MIPLQKKGKDARSTGAMNAARRAGETDETAKKIVGGINKSAHGTPEKRTSVRSVTIALGIFVDHASSVAPCLLPCKRPSRSTLFSTALISISRCRKHGSRS